VIGTTLGSYKVLSEIGSGGMGVVYLAEHTLLGRKAAVKLLRADMPVEYIERFFLEAKSAATLHHPGIVDVFDFGHHSDGSAYIVMEFLHGESLAERLAREPKLPVGLALVITRSCATALHVAHEEGIVHRDLKPGNIFLIPDNDAPAGLRTKVLDFGIAKLVRDRDSKSVKTQSGAVIGTPRYMSPEQCKNARDVDGRSDIYSLGCILYEMLLGVAPFDYDSWAELVGAHIYEEPARPREIDVNISLDVEVLVTKLLEKNPDERFRTMQELAQSLEVLLLPYGIERIRLTPPSLKHSVTPAKGVPRAASGDPTMPQSGEQRASAAKKPGAETIAAFADTSKASTEAELAAIAATMAGGPNALIAPAPAASVAAITVTQRKTPWVAIGIAGAGLVALGAAAFVVLGNKSNKAETEPAYIVVNQRGSEGGAAGGGDGTPKPVENKVETPVVTPDPVEAVTPDAGVAKLKTVPVKNPNETDVAALTRTFGKQSEAITKCFATHGQPTDDVAVRFQIGATGAVKTVEVLPASVGSSELGECIAKVAKSTQFGPQPKDAAFKIPLHTR
jgi:TonB family protein